MTFDALPARYQKWAWLGFLGASTVAVAGGLLLVHQSLTLLTYTAWIAWGLWVLGVVFYGYRLWALHRLAYHVNRDGVYVRWGHSTFVLPMAEMHSVHPPGEKPLDFPARWWRWPALYVGEELASGRRVRCFATVPVDQQWLLCGDTACLGVSPRDGQRLLLEMNRRRGLGPNRSLASGWRRPRLWRWRFWEDGTAVLSLLANALVLVLLWGEATARGREGQAQLLVGMTTLLVGLNVLLGILFYRRHRFLTLILWSSAVIVQLIILLRFWVGMP